MQKYTDIYKEVFGTLATTSDFVNGYIHFVF